MSTTKSLVAELKALRMAVAAHKTLIDNACEARDLAIEAAGIQVVYGRYDIDFSKDGWRYPSIAEAVRVVEALKDDSGYFWACSRMTDIERLVGDSFNPQLPLRTDDNYIPLFSGHIPAAHEAVSSFLAA
jgi:hypothetical protein